MNKNAQSIQFLPYLLIGVVLVVGMYIFAVPVMHMGDEIFDEMKDNEIINATNKSVDNIEKVQVVMTGWTDQLIFFLLGAVLLGFIAIAMFSDFHPIFLGVFVLFIILMAIVGGILSNVTDEVGDTSILSNKSDEFTMSNQVLGSSFPILIVVFGAVAVIVLLAKKGRVTSPI